MVPIDQRLRRTAIRRRMRAAGASLRGGLVALLVQGCALASHVPVVSVEDLDQDGIALDRVRTLQQGAGEGAVVAVLGLPADKESSCVLDGVVWRYPIRAWSDMANRREVVMAPRLRTRFDASGTLTEWGFVDARGERPLRIRESTQDAYRWFRLVSHAPAPTPPLVDLSRTLVPGRTVRQEVEQALGRWHPDLYCGNGGSVPVVSKMTTESGSEWDWYVDRPSPLFIPPHYLVVAFKSDGSLIGWHFEQTYPGGRT